MCANFGNSMKFSKFPSINAKLLKGSITDVHVGPFCSLCWWVYCRNFMKLHEVSQNTQPPTHNNKMIPQHIHQHLQSSNCGSVPELAFGGCCFSHVLSNCWIASQKITWAIKNGSLFSLESVVGTHEFCTQMMSSSKKFYAWETWKHTHTNENHICWCPKEDLQMGVVMFMFLKLSFVSMLNSITAGRGFWAIWGSQCCRSGRNGLQQCPNHESWHLWL